MTEPTITCPSCTAEIRLTESLAAPLIAATRQQFEQQLAQKNAEIEQREQAIRDKEKQITEAKRTLDSQVADQVALQLKSERSRVIMIYALCGFANTMGINNTSGGMGKNALSAKAMAARAHCAWRAPDNRITPAYRPRSILSSKTCEGNPRGRCSYQRARPSAKAASVTKW